MNYLVLKSCFAAGARRSAGDVVEVAADESVNLLAMGRISVAPAPKPEAALTDRSEAPKSTRKGKSAK